MKKETEVKTEDHEGIRLVTTTKYVEAQKTVGVEGRVTCQVFDGDGLIAEFNGATAPVRAEECIKIALELKSKGLPLVRGPKCVADGLSLRTICKDNTYRQEGLFVA